MDECMNVCPTADHQSCLSEMSGGHLCILLQTSNADDIGGEFCSPSLTHNWDTADFPRIDICVAREMVLGYKRMWAFLSVKKEWVFFICIILLYSPILMRVDPVRSGLQRRKQRCREVKWLVQWPIASEQQRYDLNSGFLLSNSMLFRKRQW